MSKKYTPRLIPGLLWSGLGMAAIAAPLGCATSHVDPVDARLFIPPALPETTSNSNAVKTELGNALSIIGVHPGPTTLESPKAASVLPDPTVPIPAPFNTIKPLEELSSTPVNSSPLNSAPADATPFNSTPANSTPAYSTPANATPNNATPAMPTSPDQATDAPSAQPAASVQTPLSTALPAPEVQGQGVYWTLGGVIAQVNDVPIYANQILAPLKKEFSAKSRTMDPAEFRYFAREEIFLQLKERIDDERYFATAYHSLTEDDKKLAEAHAMMDRHSKVIAAGGSVELARQQAADQGLDFDEMIRKDYRELVFVIYQRRQIEPLIQVSADNMRQFYNQNFDKLYHEKEQAQYLVIQIDCANYKDTATAREKIQALHTKAANGADFTELASTDNDDSLLREQHGSPCGSGQWMDRNSYRVDAVDAAIWTLQPGQVTGVIESQDKFYIAKLEARKGGATHAFEDQTVQADIYSRLRQQQFNKLWQQRKDESAVEAMVNADSKRMELAVDIAMQKYAQTQLAAGR